MKNFKLDFIYVADASDVGHLLDVATRAAEIENAFFRRGNNAGGHFKIQSKMWFNSLRNWEHIYFLDKQKLKVKTLFRLSLVLVVIGSTQTNNHKIILVTDLLNLIIWLKKFYFYLGSWKAFDI